MGEIVRATWDELRCIVQAANDELTICTPYFSSEGVGQLFDALNCSITLFFITRLSPSDWLRGISSPDELLALLQILESSGRTPRLVVHQQLHAKAYIADKACGLLGSANLTAGGFEANFELMVRLSPEEAEFAYGIIYSEISENGKELSIRRLYDWVSQFEKQIIHSRPIEDEEAEMLAEMQRELDCILGYGYQKVIPWDHRYPLVEDYVAWLEHHRELPGAEVLLDRYHNTSRLNLTGHFKQSYYGVYRFLCEHNEYIQPLSKVLSNMCSDHIFQPNDDVLRAWIAFLNNHALERGERYDFAILRGILPPSLGGTRLGGGGGSSTLKRMLPLVARFIEDRGD